MGQCGCGLEFGNLSECMQFGGCRFKKMNGTLGETRVGGRQMSAGQANIEFVLRGLS